MTSGNLRMNTLVIILVAILVCFSLKVNVQNVQQQAQIADIRHELKDIKALLKLQQQQQQKKQHHASSEDHRRQQQWGIVHDHHVNANRNVIDPPHHTSDSGISHEVTKMYSTHTTQGKMAESQYSHPKTRRYLTVPGLVGDGITDDTKAIQWALNKASNDKKNAKVVLPKGIFLITSTIRVPAGITLMGQGYGSSPLQIKFNAGGSTLAYCGTSFAVSITGHASSVQDLAITDWRGTEECINTKGKGGVIILAKGKLVESVTMRNILIYQFMTGTSILMKARKKGGIAYASFENIRVRHAKVGIHLIAEEGSFVNSNSFHDGAISGGIIEVAVRVEGPGACNDNQFNGMVIEPPSTTLAHVYVSGSKTNIHLNGVRLEGTDMPEDKPLIIIEDDSYANVMNGLLGHTFLKGDLNRNPDITYRTNKMVGIKPAEHNLFWNAAFSGLDETGTSMPGWTFTGGDVMVTRISSSEGDPPFPDHNILQITYLDENAEAFKLSPSSLPRSPIHSFCSFGIYAQSDVPGSISVVMKSGSGNTISSSPHTGGGKWEFIGMSSLYDRLNGARAYFSIRDDVNVTAPTFIYGRSQATPGAELMSSSGARMAGVLTSSFIAVLPPVNDRWYLPVESNIYETLPFPDSGEENCSTTYHDVWRINDSNPRFAEGTVITIIFPTCGGCIPCLALKHSAYIKLMGDRSFEPQPIGVSSITLISAGSGTWKEVSRNGLE